MDKVQFEACQAVRRKQTRVRHTSAQMRTFILPDRVYCAHCLGEGGDHLSDANFGRMRVQWQRQLNCAIYRCLARDRGYHPCAQPIVREQKVLDQIVEILSGMSIPQEIMARIDCAVRSRPSNEQALDQLKELQEQQQRIQFSWEFGKISPEDYIEKMSRLEREIASIRPLDYDKLEEAADLITHFRVYWDQCLQTDNPAEARQ